MISMRLMRMPHLSVTASICCWTSVLIRSRSDSAWSRVIVPITDRSAVRASASMATSKLAMLNSACWATTTWVKIVAFTVTTTLSLVMTSWRSPGPRDLSHVDPLEGFDKGRDDHEAGLVGLAVLAEVLDDADLALLDDVDHLAQRQDQHHNHEADDGETDHSAGSDGCDHGGCSCSFPSTGTAHRDLTVDRPDSEGCSLYGRDDDSGAGRYRGVVGAAHPRATARQRAGHGRRAPSPDGIEREHLLPDQPTVDTAGRGTS